MLRWFLDDTRMSALARDNDIAVSTAYDYRDEGIGTLIHTDRIATPGPTPGVDLMRATGSV